MATISNFDVYRVLIHGGKSYDIMYSNLFKMMGLKKYKLWPDEGSNVHTFNDIVTHSKGCIELMVTLGERRDTRNIDS